jgi:phosphopantetheinyl transferase
MFFLYWSLKEAFIKAVGQGLGYDLQNVSLTVAVVLLLLVHAGLV